MNYYLEDTGEKFGYTDLAIERRRANVETLGISYKKSECDVGTWEEVHVESEAGARTIGKPRGSYYTLSTQRLDLLSQSEFFDCQEELARRLCQMCDEEHIFPARILVVGLGNADLTPDSIGPKSAKLVRPTLHVYNNAPDDFEALECSEIAVCTPGVLSNTGIDSAEIVKSISRRISPDLIICIDAISTESRERLGTTFQISNTGIVPGGGVGNKMSPIDYPATGSYVFSIGVPTVINSRVLCDTGMGVSESFPKYTMLVAPREIDEIVDVGARIIAGAINQAFGIDDF
jgi:spore protease